MASSTVTESKAGITNHKRDAWHSSIAQIVLDIYNNLSDNGKPKSTEFTVLAAIVAQVGDERPFVLSLATGTRCIGSLLDSSSSGFLLSDSHAEVLARRGFCRYLYKCILKCIRDSDDPALVNNIVVRCGPSTDHAGSRPDFKINSQARFYLFVSDSPCGDCSIYDRDDGKALFTGAKLLSSSSTSGITISNATAGGLVTSSGAESEHIQTVAVSKTNESCIREHGAQELGVLRTKSGRSDISDAHRTTSMSCSDKICRWQAMGLEGALLAGLIDGPILLSGIAVGKDPFSSPDDQLVALKRALVDRMGNIPLNPHPLELVIVDCDLARSKCNSEYRAYQDSMVSEDAQRIKPASCGTSINWVRDVAFAHGIKSTDHSAVDVCNRSKVAIDTVEAIRRRQKVSSGGTFEVSLAQTGALQGATKKCIGSYELSSRLCRRSMCEMYHSIISERTLDSSPPMASGADSYHNWKCLSKRYQERRTAFLSSRPFNSWICDDPAVSEAFPFHESVPANTGNNVDKRKQRAVDSIDQKATKRAKEEPEIDLAQIGRIA